MSRAFKKGVEMATIGRSIYFNPYRHKGTSEEYLDFIAGYKSVKGERK